jgi:hypothetical protein
MAKEFDGIPKFTQQFNLVYDELLGGRAEDGLSKSDQ